MRRIASGVTDQYVYFQRQTGLDTFTVYRSRNGAAWAAMTTPTISEGDSANAPGIYQLLLDEDMTIGAGNVTEHMVFYVTHAGMSPVFLEVELFAEPNTAIAALATAVDDLPTNAELETALGAADDAVLAQVALVKAKTDQLTFTVSNQVDANAKSMNDATITGDGTAGDLWRG